MKPVFVFLLWKTRLILPAMFTTILCFAQREMRHLGTSYPIYYLEKDVIVTVDAPAVLKRNKKTIVIFYALPNGNSTDWTMGKKREPGDDWHYAIQHIGAQTRFIRQQDRKRDYIVVYLENSQKSWPAWKQRHTDHAIYLPKLIDSLTTALGGEKALTYLNGHSGGGSLVFGYLAAMKKIPYRIRRISFIDSNYGYDSTYYPVLREWLQNKQNVLTVFAYNDSVALYNGRPVVSAKGGTWYRSRLMLDHLDNDFRFQIREDDSLWNYHSLSGNIHFILKKNTDRGIYHTQQVELNGFIHSIFAGTRWDERRYLYYGARAYDHLILSSGKGE
jgi:pimeloyl-ACP methyl ester carboxylesterase